MKTETLIKDLEVHIKTLDISFDRKGIRLIRRIIRHLKKLDSDLNGDK